MDFFMNGQAEGNVAAKLLQCNMDPGILRPYIGDDGRHYAVINENGKPTPKLLTNATATLRKDAWKILDTAVVKAAKPRLKAVADLRNMGLTFNIPNGMSKTVLETETQSDISTAEVSMSGIRESNTDRPVYELTNLPLPIIHKDFQFPLRQVMVSRNSGSPLDTSTAELAGRRVAEVAEQLLLGTYGSYLYAGGTIYGYTNYPNRLTKTITAPTASGWTAATTVNEVLEMKLQSTQAFHYGPYKLYCSTAWDPYMDDDYSANKGDNTLRERLNAIEGIDSVATLDYLDTAGTSYILLLVQMTSNVVREVIGMDITTVQWESQGGMMLNFKVMAILVPQVRADQNSNTGIVHGTT
jgi:hypothetical protein